MLLALLRRFSNSLLNLISGKRSVKFRLNDNSDEDIFKVDEDDED